MNIRNRAMPLSLSIPAWLVEAFDQVAKEQDATRSKLAKQCFVRHLNESGYGHLIPPQDQEKPLPPAA